MKPPWSTPRALRPDAFGRRWRRVDLLFASGVVTIVVVGMLATGMLSVELAPAAAVPSTAPPTTQTPGQPSTGPATTVTATGGAVPSSGMSGHPPGPGRPATGQQGPARPAATTTSDAAPRWPPGPPRRVLVRVRIRPAGACVEAVAGIPPVQTCHEQGGR